MTKFNWVLSTLLVTALISSLPTSSTQTTWAQMKLSGAGEGVSGSFTKVNQSSEEPTPPVQPRRGTSRSSNSWAAVFQAFPQAQNKPPQDGQPPVPPRTAAPRGDVCAIAPKSIGSYTEIWSDQPLFVWKGPFERIEVRPVGSTQVLWNEVVKKSARQIENSGMYRITYAGKTLQPGQTYEWRMFLSTRKDARAIKTETFQVMNSQKRDRIKQELQRLDEQLKAKNSLPEEIARQRADYFAKQQLWSDVLQEAYSVENPSIALAEIRQAIPQQICTKTSGQTSVQPR